MTLKLTPKQEKFCQVFIETGNASEAYRQAYNAENMKDSTIWRNAHSLLENNKVTTRLDELNEEHQERHNITVDTLTAKYMATYHLATKSGNPGAAVSALNSLAKLHRLIIEHGTITHTGTIAHEHEGISRTVQLLRDFRGEGQKESPTRPVSH